MAVALPLHVSLSGLPTPWLGPSAGILTAQQIVIMSIQAALRNNSTNLPFIGEMAEMLEKDFASARFLAHNELNDRPFRFRIAARIARLFSPIL